MKKINICIFIVIPTHQLQPEDGTDMAQLETIKQQVKSYLQGKYGMAISPLIQAMDELYQQIDFMHSAAGIGLFVSFKVKRLIHFFFPVKGKVIIGQSSDICNLF